MANTRIVRWFDEELEFRPENSTSRLFAEAEPTCRITQMRKIETILPLNLKNRRIQEHECNLGPAHLSSI